MTEYLYADNADTIVELAGKNNLGELGGFLRERVTSGFPVITTDHALIHESIAYTLSGTVTVDAAWSLSFVTPAVGYVHFKPTGITAAGGPVTVTFLEGSTFTGGSDATPVNRNRIGTPRASTVACRTLASGSPTNSANNPTSASPGLNLRVLAPACGVAPSNRKASSAA